MRQCGQREARGEGQEAGSGRRPDARSASEGTVEGPTLHALRFPLPASRPSSPAVTIPDMPTDSFDDHLSRIATKWTLVCRAHEDEEGAAAQAQREMLDRYGGAVRRYLQGVLRDSDAADELFQEFAIRFLRGKLKGATPERGRF